MPAPWMELQLDRPRVAQLCFAQGSRVFDGHFPGQPVLPGIVLLAAVERAARELEVLGGMDRAPLLMIVGIAMLAGAAGLLAPAAAQISATGLPQFSNAGLLILLFLGILGGSVSVLLWLFAADGIAPVHLSHYFALAPASGLLMAFLVIGEPPAVSLLIGIVLLAAGILAALWKPKPQRRERRGFR